MSRTHIFSFINMNIFCVFMLLIINDKGNNRKTEIKVEIYTLKFYS